MKNDQLLLLQQQLVIVGQLNHLRASVGTKDGAILLLQQHLVNAQQQLVNRKQQLEVASQLAYNRIDREKVHVPGGAVPL